MLLQRAARRSAAGGARCPARVFCAGAKAEKPAAHMSLAAGLAAGGLAGVLSGLSGVGGGMVLIPAVAKMTSMPMQTVNGTCLGGLTVGASVGAYNYAQVDACNYPLALLTSLPAIAFARVGVRAAHRVSSSTLSKIVGVGMLASVPFIALKNSDVLAGLLAKLKEHLSAAGANGSVAEGGSSQRNPLDLQYFHTHHRTPAKEDDLVLLDAITADPLAFAEANLRYLAVGAFAGFVSGLCGIGGSMLTTTYLTAGTEMPQAVVIGTTLVSVLPMAFSANYFNYKSKSIHFPTALKIGSSLVLSIYCTSKFILHYKVIPEDFLRGVLATTIGIASIAMIRRPI